MVSHADILGRPLVLAGPRWIGLADTACFVVLNLGVAAEVVIVFLNTALRVVHMTLMPGMDETARLLLIGLAFLGGAVAYGRGQFMAITYVAARLPAGLRPGVAALVDCFVVLVAAVVGRASIPLQVFNAGEHTTLLGIGYIWMTLPVTIGCGLFMVHAGETLVRRPAYAVIFSGLILAAAVLALVLGREGTWVDTPALYGVLAGAFIFQMVIGVPVGFVLASVGMLYVRRCPADRSRDQRAARHRRLHRQVPQPVPAGPCQASPIGPSAMIERDVTIVTKHGAMPAFAACPDGTDKVPPVILCMDAPGTREELRNMARRIAKMGYVCLLPDLYSLNKLKVYVFPNAQLGSIKEMLTAVQLGTLSMSLAVMSAEERGILTQAMQTATDWEWQAQPITTQEALKTLGGLMQINPV